MVSKNVSDYLDTVRKECEMERVKVSEAAKLLGVSEQYVRIGMQRGLLPIGSCVKTSTKWTYHISPYLLRQYIGEAATSQI